MQQIEWVQFLTAKTRRARREDAMNRTKEEIEQIAELVVDAMLNGAPCIGARLIYIDVSGMPGPLASS